MNDELDPVWFVIFSEKVDGPFTLDELAMDWRLTRETLVRREGESVWLPAWDFVLIRAILKLQEKEKQQAKIHVDEKPTSKDDVIVLDRSPTPNIFWFLLALLIVVFVILRYLQMT